MICQIEGRHVENPNVRLISLKNTYKFVTTITLLIWFIQNSIKKSLKELFQKLTTKLKQKSKNRKTFALPITYYSVYSWNSVCHKCHNCTAWFLTNYCFMFMNMHVIYDITITFCYYLYWCRLCPLDKQTE